MTVHSELFRCYGAPTVAANHGGDHVCIRTVKGNLTECPDAVVGPVSYENEVESTLAGDITSRVARRAVTIHYAPPLDSVVVIGDDEWAIERISSSGELTRVHLIRVLADTYGSKQI